MPRTSSNYRTAQRQAGAALVVGLLLLLVLTVLGISGMNSSSLNLIMAGNTQYSQAAFEAAESGIENAIAGNIFNPDPTIDPETATDDVGALGKYTTTSTTQLCGCPQPALYGSSQDSFSTYHFEVESIGESNRGASSRNIQAIAVIAPATTSFAPVPVVCPGSGSGASKVLE